MADVDRLAEQKYVSLTTYRKDGTPVATPLWVVRDGVDLVVWTIADSWKVKRLRRNPEITIAPCDMRGRLTGDPVPGRAELMSTQDAVRIRELMKKKYGVLGRLVIWGSRLRRGANGTVGVRVTL